MLAGQNGWTQSNKIKQLETEAANAKGAAKIEALIALSDAQMYAGDLEKAIVSADNAEDLAEKLRLPELRANAMNREGKALLLAGKKRPDRKFEQSLAILRTQRIQNNTLALDNLENLKSIAKSAGKTQLVQQYEVQILRIKSGGTLTEDAPVNRQEMQKELTDAQRQLLENQIKFREEQTKMLQNSKALQDELAAKNAELENLTEEQMKARMVMMQQKLMLDSVSYTRGMDSLAVSNANLALREADSNRKFNYAAIGVLLLLAGGSTFSFFRARQNAHILAEKNKTIKEEQLRSDTLLLNILPTLVADELKKQGRTKARYFEDVGVLFADFVGFSKIAEVLSPQQLVSELDTCFQKFDEIIAKHGLEKIKTIGDAYMCAGGLPDGGGSQLIDIVSAAKEMQTWLKGWNQDREKMGLPRFDARIGIHRGPVVAGVVGSKKFAFDIWGDTVNIAARVEQAGEGGRINVSGEVFQNIKETYPCHYRGKIAAKNKGEIDMYYVE
jgi:class 3 adenylate cyclase